ncbi:hypothetical protein BJ322DRAFT_1108684 [Thelephora terrestris]|uniref:Ubiquitin carboxyl-terminal hydrolase n=1 Tax=Thelephora terrestris TaxID=56493 RepID=A0A9P6HG57_9AGAM|nr:hypothetical protein BJ322DRAFT_1108684 [Thelephora terrestris]
MAITKWISFGANQQSPTSHPASTQGGLPLAVAVPSAVTKEFGFENFGNTCYANSVLQALYFCNPFRELVLQLPDPSTRPELPIAQAPQTSQSPPPTTPVRRRPERKYSATDSQRMSEASWNNTPTISGPPIPSMPRTLSSALKSLFAHISKNPGDKGTVAPRAFIEKLKELNELFRSSMHQDAHEFLNYLLNRIVEETEAERKSAQEPDRSNPSSSTIVHRLFEGVLTSETRCLTCETVSSRDESFLDLSIDIEQNSSVTACLRQFSASEMLCQKNKFFCDGCCDLQEAEKRMKIKKLPNVLALHLKRFKYQEEVQKYIKLTYRVAFPMELRLFNTVDDTDDPDRLYELYAIVVHIGNGPHHGHYVSIVKAGGVWKLFDDDNVETIRESDIPKYFGDSNCGSAYVLYYQAVDINLPSLGLRPPTPQPTTNPAPVPVPVSVASDDSQAPALPPGLTTEHDSSDLAESSGPTTPAPSNPTYSPKINSSPTHSKPNLPSHDFPPPPPIPQQPPPKSQGGLFHSLRHVPSVKIKGHSSEKKPPPEAVAVSTNSSASGSTSSPANVSSPQLLSTFEVIPSISGNPPVESTPQNGNGVGKDKWYKRKGTKNKEKEKASTPFLRPPLLEKRPRTAPGKQSYSQAPPSPASTGDSASQRSSSPSHPQSESEGKGEGPAISPNLRRKSSEPVPRRSPANSRSTPSFADDIPVVPPLPPLPSSPLVQVHRTPRPLPQTPSSALELPQRRATVVGGGTTGQKFELNGHAKPNGDVADHHLKLRPNSLHADMTTSSSSSEVLTPTPGAPLEPSPPLPDTEPPFSGTTSGMTATEQENAVAESNWKKATRKLSLTGTMLGFTRKEKYRDKLGGIPPGPT